MNKKSLDKLDTKNNFLDLYKEFNRNYKKLMTILNNGEPVFEWIQK